MVFRYRDRADGGRILALHLEAYANRDDVLALALPRGGVPVAFVAAQALRVPLDVILVRKLGVPNQEELAMGAVASGGFRFLHDEVISGLGVSWESIEEQTRVELAELARRERLYRGERPAPVLRDKTVLLIDDGLATGSSMRVAARAVRARSPARVVIAVPVGAPETCRELEAEADEVVCPLMPEELYAVGLWYEDFSQVTDDEVRDLLERAGRKQARFAA